MCLISKVLLQLPLTDTPFLLSYISTVTSSPRSTSSLLKSRCKCPNISSEAVRSPLGGAATRYEYGFMTILTPLSNQSLPQGGNVLPSLLPCSRANAHVALDESLSISSVFRLG